MKYLIPILLITVNCLLITVNPLFSQQSKYNETVKIVADFTPTISDAFKINLNPRIEDTIVETPKLAYSINSVRMNTEFRIEPIKAIKLPTELQDKLYNSFLKAGFGNYITPYAEYFFNSTRSKDYNAGFHIKHLSSNAKEGIKGYNNSKYSDNEASVYAKYFLTNHTIYGNVNFQRNMVHYYGHRTDSTNDKYKQLYKDSDIIQRYALIEFNGGIINTNHDSRRIDHELNFKLYNMADNYSARENNLSLNGFVSKNIAFMSSAKDQKAMISSELKYFQNNNDIVNTGGTDFKVIPQLLTDFDKVKIDLGLNFNIRADAASEFHIYPLINVDLNLVNEMLYAYAGVNGELKKNNLREISEENPFISSNTELNYTNNKFRFYGGIKGNVSKNISYNATLSNTNVHNMPLFVNEIDTAKNAKNLFSLIYEDAQILNLKAEVSIQIGEKLGVMLRGNYFNYSMSDTIKAWEKPAYDLRFTTNYHYNDKLILKADFTGLFEIYARAYDVKKVGSKKVVYQYAEKLKNIFDINLGAEYVLTNQLSAFINFNNLCFSSYKRWYNYPTQKFNVLGGISYKF